MKILWIVNTIFPYPSNKLNIKENCFGGWLNGLSENITKNKEIELAIATVYNGQDIKEYHDETITYYLIPGAPALKYNKTLEMHWKEINSKFKPDLVHIHGTEFAHGLAFLNACPDVKEVISIQGLTYKIAQMYLGNIRLKEIIKNITFRDILKMDNLFQQRKKFERRGKNEKELIKKSNVIIGRTTWDYANVKEINPSVKYYIGNETLRKEFYNAVWNINKIDKHTLFCSQAGYPIKGVHFLIETVYILKENYKYRDIKLYIAGTNILENVTLKNKIRRTGYAKLIKKLIKKYDLEKNIIFTGILNENEMIERLLKTHVFVLPSVIENSSNSLGEAMILGMPCVASNTGGTMDILEHKKEGYLYPHTEPAMCAKYISDFFEDDSLAIKCGENAKEKANIRHNPQKNVEDIVEIYKKTVGEK